MRTGLAATLIIVTAILVPTILIISCRKSDSKKDNFNAKAEKLIGKYQHLDPLCPGRSITILPYTDSIEEIRKTVNSLLSQTCSVNQVIMTLPVNKKIDLPEDLKKVINLYESGKDYGEIGNSIVPTLLREADANTLVIIVKTGITYNKNFLKDMLRLYQKQDTAIFQSNGCILSTGMLSSSVLDTKIDALEQLKEHLVH